MQNIRKISLGLGLVGAIAGAADPTDILLERELPVRTSVTERWRNYFERKVALQRVSDNSLLQFIDPGKVWELPATGLPVVITVAFAGGNAALHRQIADAARKWQAAGNLVFDFGEKAGQFRTWARTDAATRPDAADIRISFDRLGYIQSAIGKEARDIAHDQETMNLGGFDQSLPGRWQYYVLHEFGHALGLLHELQHPESTCTLRWDDDAGYSAPTDANTQALPVGELKPGIYTFLGSAPNHWPRAKVREQLAIITDPALEHTNFDPKSVMIYPLANWLFKDPASECALERSELSPADIRAIQQHYPKTAKGLEVLRQDQEIFVRQVSALMRAE